MSSSSSAASTPPPPNPVLSAYDSFLQKTPLVTRSVLLSATASYLLSFFVPSPSLHVALTNIPYFTVFHLELYRLLLSNVLCTSIFNLIFAFIIFLDYGKRLEYAMGSTNFAVLLLMTIGVGVNLIFTAGTIFLYVVTGCTYKPYIMHQCGGVWLLILGVIAVECSLTTTQAQQLGSTASPTSRRLFFFEVQTIYYPLALLGLFTIFGFDYSDFIPNAISIAIGYAYGFGKLDFVKLSMERRRRLEMGLLRSFTGRVGWVSGPTTGSNDAVMIAPRNSANSNTNTNSNNNRTTNAWGTFMDNANATDLEQGWTPTVVRSREASIATSNTSMSSSGGGQVLGRDNAIVSSSDGINSITNRRIHLYSESDKNAERERRLAAAERRVQHEHTHTAVERNQNPHPTHEAKGEE